MNRIVEIGVSIFVLTSIFINLWYNAIVQKVSAQITWSDNLLILEKVKEFEKRTWYINETAKNGWSYDILDWQIKSKLYERQAISDKVNNFQNTLPDVQSDLAIQTMKDPYIFDFISLKGKVKEFEPTDAGQLNFYLSAIDDLVKDETDNPSIGLLLCKSKDKFIAEYALKDINKPIGVSEYQILQDIPEYLQSQLSKAEDIELHIQDIED